MPRDCTNPPGTFPSSDWAEPFLDAHLIRPEVPLLDPAALALPPPADIAYGDECARLIALKPLRAPCRAEIDRQALSDLHGIQPVLDAAGLDLDRPPNPAGTRFRRIIQENLWGPIFSFKRKFNRDRPWNCCGPSLEALFQRPHSRYPGHPAYPSGHATMAYAWAYLLGEFHQDKRQELLVAAARIAFNREVAGVHFPSDSEAGRRLGQQLAHAILASDRLAEAGVDTIKSGTGQDQRVLPDAKDAQRPAPAAGAPVT